MREHTATFRGHTECLDVSQEQVRAEIINLIEKGVYIFMSGGMGRFDRLCAGVVYELKKKYPHIRNILVIPYLSFNVYNKEIFDEIIYPYGFEKYYFKSAIPARNKYLVNNSTYAICYVKFTWGGAAQTYKYAKQQDINIIDVV